MDGNIEISRSDIRLQVLKILPHVINGSIDLCFFVTEISMNDNYNQLQNDFIKSKSWTCHNLTVLEDDRDIVWLMIGRDNWQLQARPSIISEPLKEVGNKINNHFHMYSTLSFTGISRSTLQDCTMTKWNSNTK